MFNKILKKLGYVRESDISFDYCLGVVALSLGDPTEYTLTKELETQFFKDLAAVDNVNTFLNATLAADIQREFGSDDQKYKQMVKGSFGRTIYFKKGVRDAMNLLN